MSSNGITVGPLAGINFSKTTFLVADDKAFFRDMVHTALMRAGARDVKHATNIETAIELLGRYGQQIGCVICAKVPSKFATGFHLCGTLPMSLIEHLSISGVCLYSYVCLLCYVSIHVHVHVSALFMNQVT